ncbi:MAG: hypothetical protein ACW9W3_03290 [Candidatus Nitrosopumilus sp. bin_68KS]
MKEKKEFLDVNYKIWKDMCQATLFNIHSILESVKDLLEKNIEENKDVLSDHPFVAAGLYTFAVEEYGKFLLLHSIEEQKGIFQIKYRDEFRKHWKKFPAALLKIPEECKLIHKGGFGANYGNNFDTDEIADFESRLGIFYSDFDENHEVQKLPQVDAKSLNVALTKFTEIIEDELEEFNKKYQK